MKRPKRQQTRPPSSKPVMNGAEPPPLSRSRLWVFRGGAIFLVPLLVFGAVELGLRGLGFGHPTSFFLEAERNGRKVHVDNGRFGFRFFPPGLARTPPPLVMPAEKATGAKRIFVLGESAALGDPKPAYGFGRYLQVLLDERFPDTEFEVVCAAMTAINSHVILPIARECRKHEGDFWVVYMGNNEVLGPYGPTGALGGGTPGLPVIRATLALKKTRTGQWLDGLLERSGSSGAGVVWRGLRLWEGRQIAPDHPGRTRVEEHFRRNLRDILATGARAGVQTVLCTVASNLEHCAPYASEHSAALEAGAKETWDRLYQAGAEAETAGDFEQALEAYQQAAELDPRHAELQFRLARRHQASGRLGEARHHYELARDHDALPFRATTRLNEITRQAALEFKHRGVALVDVEARLAEAAPGGILGSDLFLDHVHFNFEGNYRLALLVAEEIAQRLPGAARDRGEWPSALECELRLGLTTWNRYLTVETMLNRLSDAPYSRQLDNPDTRRRHAQTLSELSLHMNETGPQRVRGIYQNALDRAPEDHFLHQNYAEYLELSGNLPEAAARWKEVTRLIPHHPLAYFQAGRLRVRLDQFEEAETELDQVLALRKDFPEAWIEWGKALAGRDRHGEALEKYAEALRLDPENAAGYFHAAESLAAQKRLDEAIEHLRETVRLWPGHWEARYFLGVELALRQEIDEAVEQFQEVIRWRPGHPAAHFNLGVGLAQQGRLAAAAAAFEKTLELNPAHASAREYLQQLAQLQRKASRPMPPLHESEEKE